MSKIACLVMDVDGTLTDGKIYMGENGEICKAFNIKDGYGIHNILISSGICPIIMTGRKSKIVENRCKELGITQIYQNVMDKKKKLDGILSSKDYAYSNVAYIGDDINDLECMNEVKAMGGYVGCPANASSQVLEVADFISHFDGGNGAVREFIEWLMHDDNTR